MERSYPAKVDDWVKYLLLLIIVGTSILPFWVPADDFWIVALTIYLSNALLIWLWMSTKTILSDDYLQHCSGPFRYRVPYGNIKLIKKKATYWIQHGTFSMDKMQINHTKGILVIAPESKEELIDEIMNKNPKIKLI